MGCMPGCMRDPAPAGRPARSWWRRESSASWSWPRPTSSSASAACPSTPPSLAPPRCPARSSRTAPPCSPPPTPSRPRCLSRPRKSPPSCSSPASGRAVLTPAQAGAHLLPLACASPCHRQRRQLSCPAAGQHVEPGPSATEPPMVVLSSRPASGNAGAEVVSTAPLLGSKVTSDARHPVWLHVHVRPPIRNVARAAQDAFESPVGRVVLKSEYLVEGHWVLAMTDPSVRDEPRVPWPATASVHLPLRPCDPARRSCDRSTSRPRSRWCSATRKRSWRRAPAPWPLSRPCPSSSDGGQGRRPRRRGRRAETTTPHRRRGAREWDCRRAQRMAPRALGPWPSSTARVATPPQIRREGTVVQFSEPAAGERALQNRNRSAPTSPATHPQLVRDTTAPAGDAAASR